jgi:hypothetical protein
MINTLSACPIRRLDTISFLVNATKGTMFMGVPHTGIDEVRLATVVANIARLSFNVTRTNLDDLVRSQVITVLIGSALA